MRYGFVLQRHRSQLSLGTLAGFSNGIGHLVSLAKTQTNPPLLVTNNYQSAKAKSATTLDHLSGAVDENRFLNKSTVTIPLGLLVTTARPVATFATMITTPFRPIGPRGNRWLLRCFYLGFFRHKCSSDGV